MVPAESRRVDASRAVPAWARNQLRATAAAPDVEALARGASGGAYWDDCQKCLVLSGELHNNVRMAWGKAIPAWHGAVLNGQKRRRRRASRPRSICSSV